MNNIGKRPKIFGLDIPEDSDLPEGCVALGAIAAVKILDPEGEIGVFMVVTDDLTPWEAIGMSVALNDDLRDAVARAEED